MNSQVPERAADAEKKGVDCDKASSFGETMNFSGDTASLSQSGLQSAPEQWVGRRLGKYEITALLGVGGMGVVLKGHDPSIERDVAIKVLPADLSADEASLHRFLAEAKSAGKLNHPNAVTIYEVAQEGPAHYLVMEIVSAGSAAEHLEQAGAYSVGEATRIAIEACKGLSAAHEVGLVHRDIKPANLLLTQNGTVKVSDFGLAKRTQSQTMLMTQAGHIVGTPYYMSPEQCESREVDARSDIYSLGGTYYSLLTGKSPFQDSASIIQVMYAHCNAGPPDPREVSATVPAVCAQIVQRAMATKPEQRYQSMDEMRADLEALLAAMSGAGITLPSQSATNLSRPPAAPTPVSQSRFRWAAVAGTAMTLVAAAAAAFFMFGLGSRDGGTKEAINTGANKNNLSPTLITPPTGEPIRVGILHSLTGTMAHNESAVADATLLAIHELNRDGGLLGRPIEGVVADGRSDSTTFAREAERLINKEHVCTVFGCWTSASRKTVVPIFEEHNHLLVYPVQYEGIEESPNVIYTGAAPNQQIIPAVKWAYAFENKRRFFLVGSDYVFPRVAHAIIKDQLKELGAELVGEEYLPLGSTVVQPIIEKIRSAKPDVILNSINGDSNLAFFTDLRKAGITPQSVPTISFSVEEETLRQLDVSAMVGDYAAWNYFQSVESPENHKFVSSFRAKYGPQRVVTDPMEAAYFGVKLWAKAVADAQSTDVSEIRRAMLNQRIRSPGGDVRIDPATQHTFKTPRIGRVLADGQFEVVWTAAKPEPPIPYPPSRSTEEWRAFLHDLYSGWGNHWSAGPNQ
ncbi:MAG: transporter substrate-binding protein [Pirellulales bacterium]